jgi:hypothetical protein
MNPALREPFFDAADAHTCWIGLREPNPLSERWIGQRGYTPKMMDCKAKTADNPTHRLAGLVVDPTRCPDAFRTESLAAAKHTWKEKFLKNGVLPIGFEVSKLATERGLVRYKGQAIYADFDLMAINRANENGDFVPTSESEETALFNLVAPMLNAQFGVDMVQHGAEFMWTGGVGARESEYVYWFGPGRRFRVAPSSMPHGGH